MLFLAHIHTKDTNFIFGTPHTQYRYTQINGHTQTQIDTDVVPLSHFALFVTCMYAKDTNFIFGMPQTYTWTDGQTHAHTSAETPAHTDTEIYTQTYISTHADIHRHTCIFFYIHKHTYIYVRSILPAHFIFSCHLPNELRSPWTYFFLQGWWCTSRSIPKIYSLHQISWHLTPALQPGWHYYIGKYLERTRMLDSHT